MINELAFHIFYFFPSYSLIFYQKERPVYIHDNALGIFERKSYLLRYAPVNIEATSYDSNRIIMMIDYWSCTKYAEWSMIGFFKSLVPFTPPSQEAKQPSFLKVISKCFVLSRDVTAYAFLLIICHFP